MGLYYLISKGTCIYKRGVVNSMHVVPEPLNTVTRQIKAAIKAAGTKIINHKLKVVESHYTSVNLEPK